MSHRFKWYVGVRHSDSSRQAFATTAEPTKEEFQQFGYVIGPFRTKQGATWAAKHRYGWADVDEAEEMAKIDLPWR